MGCMCWYATYRRVDLGEVMFVCKLLWIRVSDKCHKCKLRGILFGFSKGNVQQDRNSRQIIASCTLTWGLVMALIWNFHLPHINLSITFMAFWQTPLPRGTYTYLMFDTVYQLKVIDRNYSSNSRLAVLGFEFMTFQSDGQHLTYCSLFEPKIPGIGQAVPLANVALKQWSFIYLWPTSLILFSFRNISLIFNSSSWISLDTRVFGSTSTENTKHTPHHISWLLHPNTFRSTFSVNSYQILYLSGSQI